MFPGGLVITESHKCPSEKLFEPRELRERLKVFISRLERGVKILSILPSPFSKASQLLLINVHFFPVWRSFTTAWLKYQEGLFPELSCQTRMYCIIPSDIGKWITNLSSFPRAKIFLELIMSFCNTMGWLSASLPWMTMATLASVPDSLQTPVTTVKSYS